MNTIKDVNVVVYDCSGPSSKALIQVHIADASSTEELMTLVNKGFEFVYPVRNGEKVMLEYLSANDKQISITVADHTYDDWRDYFKRSFSSSFILYSIGDGIDYSGEYGAYCSSMHRIGERIISEGGWLCARRVISGADHKQSEGLKV